ncbi:ABC transporter ATP-binding protein [Alteromonadales bacterium alter-6D02]|nr:ABC transporter ATP-binding protein [Alteromonadales bacterium alter-6D02]
MSKIILAANNLVKRYDDVCAVDNLSFEIIEGECFGLLGPNGAGKSTTIEILENVISADGGEVLFYGKAIDDRFAQSIGIQFQSTALQDYLTVSDTLRLFRALYDNPVPTEQLVEDCALEELLNRDNRKLSGGQRQRLLLALALINDPKLVFLDEPTTGLDPQARRNFWQLITRQKQAGKTILLTTHYMDEAQILCDRVAIVEQGKIIAVGAPDELLLEHLPGMMIRLPSSAINHCQLPHLNFEFKQDSAQLISDDVNQTIAELLNHEVDLTGLTINAPTLEDLFIHLTGHQLRE